MNLSHFVLAIFSLKAHQRRQSGLQILFLCLNLTNLLFQQGKFCFIYFVLWKKCRGTWMYTVKPSDCICSNFYMRLIFFWILTAWGLCICKWGMFFPWDFQNFNKMALCNYMYVCFRITFECHNSLPVGIGKFNFLNYQHLSLIVKSLVWRLLLLDLIIGK